MALEQLVQLAAKRNSVSCNSNSRSSSNSSSRAAISSGAAAKGVAAAAATTAVDKGATYIVIHCSN